MFQAWVLLLCQRECNHGNCNARWISFLFLTPTTCGREEYTPCSPLLDWQRNDLGSEQKLHLHHGSLHCWSLKQCLFLSGHSFVLFRVLNCFLLTLFLLSVVNTPEMSVFLDQNLIHFRSIFKANLQCCCICKTHAFSSSVCAHICSM